MTHSIKANADKTIPTGFIEPSLKVDMVFLRLGAIHCNRLHVGSPVIFGANKMSENHDAVPNELGQMKHFAGVLIERISKMEKMLGVPQSAQGTLKGKKDGSIYDQDDIATPAMFIKDYCDWLAFAGERLDKQVKSGYLKALHEHKNKKKSVKKNKKKAA